MLKSRMKSPNRTNRWDLRTDRKAVLVAMVGSNWAAVDSN